MNIIQSIIDTFIITEYGWRTYLAYSLISLLIIAVVGLIIMAILRARKFRELKKNYKENKNIRVINKGV